MTQLETTPYTADHADHPFACEVCTQRYRSIRTAADHCGQTGCVDTRTGTFIAFDLDQHEAAEERERAYWVARDAECHFECSCGERFDSVDAAIRCRKCRTYTEANRCTEVFDLEVRSADGRALIVWSHERPDWLTPGAHAFLDTVGR